MVLWLSRMGEVALVCSLNLSAKVLPESPNIFFFTVHHATLVSVNHPTLLEDGDSVHRVHQEVLDGTASFEMHFNTMLPADVLAAFIHAFNTGHHHVGLVVAEACVVPGVTGILGGSVGFSFV